MGKTDPKPNVCRKYKPVFTWCKAELDQGNFSRRCFMTGEYCSKLDSIQKERDNLHKDGAINAFVVMSFSNVSDVVYKWRIKSFIENLKGDLFFHEDPVTGRRDKLYCVSRLSFPEENRKEEEWDQSRAKRPEKEPFDELRQLAADLDCGPDILRQAYEPCRKGVKLLKDVGLEELLKTAPVSGAKMKAFCKKLRRENKKPKDRARRLMACMIESTPEYELQKYVTTPEGKIEGFDYEQLPDAFARVKRELGETENTVQSLHDLLARAPVPIEAAVDLVKECTAQPAGGDPARDPEAEKREDGEAGRIDERSKQLIYLLMQLTIPTYGTRKNENTALIPVERINVIRADSDPSTNFVICNRICQQLQIADLVVVDVSVANANVFYELGMAVAMGKMILPMCYSDTYFKMTVPEELVKRMAPEALEKNPDELKNKSQLEHHIDCFRWRRELFEHFGIRYRNVGPDYTDRVVGLRAKEAMRLENGLKPWLVIPPHHEEQGKWVTQYARFRLAVGREYGFEDQKYGWFPYQENVNSGGLEVKGKGEEDRTGLAVIRGKVRRGDYLSIGESIYTKLQYSYNLSTGYENTLVVYTMDGFLNDGQAALCIVNYFNAIVRQFHDGHCFCGERVGVLLQGSIIQDDEKDGDQNPHYSVGDIIQIGTNQATYKAHMDIIKPDDFLTSKVEVEATVNETKAQIDHLQELLELGAKEFIRNRGIPIYPKEPFYVKRIIDGVQQDVFADIEMHSSTYGKNKEKESQFASYFYCLYHVMLRTLKYTNEIVVDIGTNSIQSLFWLGAAHGSDTSAITVRYEAEDRGRAGEEQQRFIFDVAGLWTALYREKESTDGFYYQLAKAQAGIEQYSKLILKNRDRFTDDVVDAFWASNPKRYRKKADPAWRSAASEGAAETDDEKKKQEDYVSAMQAIADAHTEKENAENAALESYYRNRFWRPMLRYNRLKIYLSQEPKEKTPSAEEPRPYVLSWDVNAVGTLSNYLSRKKTIGKYTINVLKLKPGGAKRKRSESDLEKTEGKDNFICVGRATTDISLGDGQNVPQYLAELFTGPVSRRRESPVMVGCPKYRDREVAVYKGFERDGAAGETVMAATQLSCRACSECFAGDSPIREGKLGFDGQVKFLGQEKTGYTLDDQSCHLIKKEDPATKRPAVYHMELAQLLLWREAVGSGSNRKDYFRVAISGGSGPATAALTYLLVDSKPGEDRMETAADSELSCGEDQTKRGEGKKKDIEILKQKKYPLLVLQEKIRRKFLLKYRDDLRPKLEEQLRNQPSKIRKGEKELKLNEIRYADQVTYAAELYLSTVLYRYFLPFLSQEDVERICNGMKMFVSSLRLAKRSPFAKNYPRNRYDSFNAVIDNETVMTCADEVVRVLGETLNDFCGVEAFYCVEVRDEQFDDEGNDNRVIEGITLCPDSEEDGRTGDDIRKLYLRCLFRKKEA